MTDGGDGVRGGDGSAGLVGNLLLIFLDRSDRYRKFALMRSKSILCDNVFQYLLVGKIGHGLN